MTYFLLSYLVVGLTFGWFWYFKYVRSSAESADYLFYLMLSVLWPFPAISALIYKIRG